MYVGLADNYKSELDGYEIVGKLWLVYTTTGTLWKKYG
jgi:hypothetical protein